MINTTVGTLTVVGPAESKRGHRYWLTRCTCGLEKAVRAQTLRAGTARCACDDSVRKDTTAETLATIQETLREIKALLTANKPLSKLPTPPKPTPEPALTLKDILGTGERFEQLRQSVEKAAELLQDPTDKNIEQARQRLAIDTETIYNDPDATRAATRSARNQELTRKLQSLL